MSRNINNQFRKFEREIYFNLNYRTFCNNNCLFCDSDEGTEEITSSQISEILKKEKITPKDRIVYCGGEPTVHSQIVEIMEITKKYGANIYFLSNGRKFKDFTFAKKITEEMKGCISIPIYGHVSTLHDYLTQSVGSFAETMKGIENLFKLRDEYNFHFQIELKVLTCKPNYIFLPKIVTFIQKKFPSPDYVVISSLDVSKRVRKNFSEVFISLKESAPYVKEAIKNWEKKEALSLYFIPPCVLGSEEYFAYTRKGNLCIFPDVYYDPKNLQGIRGFTESKKGPQCRLCKYNISCDGIWQRYAKIKGFRELVPFT
jgi:MoaA/NifB/PqqE/SkfB family radical SAM enzyme